MTKKIWLLIAFAILLGGLSLYLNRDWFAKDNIQISHRSQPSRLALLRRKRAADDSAVEPVVFFFDRKLKLTCLKVIPLSAIETNKYPHPIWHIVSESNSVPTRDFVYGAPIRGMHAAVPGAIPDPLEPGITYRLVVEAGPFKGQHDFVPMPRP